MKHKPIPEEWVQDPLPGMPEPEPKAEEYVTAFLVCIGEDFQPKVFLDPARFPRITTRRKATSHDWDVAAIGISAYRGNHDVR